MRWLIFFIPIFIFAQDCVNYFNIKETDSKYEILVFGYQDDLSLEAKALLYTYIKKKNRIKYNFYLEVSNFLPIKEYDCKNRHYEVYIVDKNSIKIKEGLEYKEIRREIFKKIAKIKAKEKPSLSEMYKLYNLYRSIGKIKSANKVLDKIFELEMKGL
ncbi:MAG TPA: hypothetical protein EYP79_02460 [Campylobacterales bacterium]|nr:hypothetical protein [Campylobacterales bacterium]